MARHIAIVFEPDYSAELAKLAFHTPVWLVDTPENRAAAEVAWHSAVEWPHITVTLFREEDWKTLIDMIRVRERAVDSIEVVGAPLTAPTRAALSGAGFERFDETANGFRVRR